MKYSKELKAGIVVVVTLLCFWWVFQYLKGNDVFTKGNVYYVTYKNVAGLQETKPVTINGFKVGKVDEISPIADDKGNYKYRVKIVVNEEFRFNKSSQAEIYQPEIMGGKEVRIILSDQPPLAENGDEIEGVINPSITDVLSAEVTPLKEKSMAVLSQLDSTLQVTRAVLNQAKSANLKNTIAQTNRTLESFQKTSNKAGYLIEKNSEAIYMLLKDANVIMDNLNGTMKQYGEVATKVQDLKVERSLDDLHQTMNKLNDFLDKLNNDEGSLHKILTDASLYNNLNQTTESMNSLLQDLEQNPKRYINISVFGKK